MNRNAIYDALMALGSGVTGSFGGFVDTGRRLKLWDQAQFPALYQVEPDDMVTSHLGTLPKRELKVTWVIYHAVGKDQSSTPARTTSDMIDAVEAVFPVVAAYQTLGGLVHAAFIDGTIKKFEGDLDGQTIITIPITLLVP